MAGEASFSTHINSSGMIQHTRSKRLSLIYASPKSQPLSHTIYSNADAVVTSQAIAAGHVPPCSVVSGWSAVGQLAVGV